MCSAGPSIREQQRARLARQRSFDRSLERVPIQRSDWPGDFVQLYGCEIRTRENDNAEVSGWLYLSRPDPDRLDLWGDGSANRPRTRGGFAVIQSGGGERPMVLRHFASGSMTPAARPAGAFAGNIRPLEMELCAIAAALERAAELVSELRSRDEETWDVVVCLCDSKDALVAMGNYRETPNQPQMRVGEYSTIKILRCAEKLKNLGVHVVLEEVRGHRGIDGNAAADLVAKAQLGVRPWPLVKIWRSSPWLGGPILDLPDA
ncbi:hypothetical protein SLS57_009277 [Botryosphaeria dothidea]